MKRSGFFRTVIAADAYMFRSSPVLCSLYVLSSLVQAFGLALGLQSTRYIANMIFDTAAGKPAEYRLLVILLVLNMVVYVITTLRKLMFSRIKLKAKHDFELSLCEKYSKLRWEYFENKSTAESLKEACEKSFDGIINMFRHTYNYLYYALSTVVFMYYLSNFSWWIVAMYAGLLLISVRFSNRIFQSNYSIWDKILPIQNKRTYIESLVSDTNPHQESQKNRLFRRISETWAAYYKQEYKLRMKIYGKYEIVQQVSRLVMNTPYIIMLVVSGHAVFEGRQDIGFLIMGFDLFNRVVNLFGEMESDIHADQEQAGFVDSYFETMTWDEEPQDYHGEILAGVAFNVMSYTYPQAKDAALNGIRVKLSMEEKVFLAGRNGSGKTTFALLFSSLIDILPHGNILIDGKETARIPVMRNNAACLFQDFEKYRMTIKENIMIGRKGCVMTDDETVELLNKVGLSEYVEKLPRGIHTMLGQIGEDGVELSGGQWQRLAIARLLANTEARIWILDEPTAYLDPLAEVEMYKLIMNLAQDKLVLFISHRLGFARNAGRIIVFDNGRLIEDSTHNDLMVKDGLYSRMYNYQRQWYS
jgi:ATP-binding cassette subfamily B protein